MGEDSPAPGTIFSVKLFCFCLILTVQLHFCCTCSVESPVASASHITVLSTQTAPAQPEVGRKSDI